MRLQEFADSKEQIKLWKLISDSVWKSIEQQAIDQGQKRAHTKKEQSTPFQTAKPRKRASAIDSSKSSKQNKSNQNITDKFSKQANRQISRLKPEQTQVLPKAFTSMRKPNVSAPQSQLTSSERRVHDPNSVANVQRQLYPFANNDFVKRLTQ